MRYTCSKIWLVHRKLQASLSIYRPELMGTELTRSPGLGLCAECSVRQCQEKQVNPCLSTFRPAGWDNEKKIAILHENFTTVKPEDVYEDFITKPPVRKVHKSITLKVVGGFF